VCRQHTLRVKLHSAGRNRTLRMKIVTLRVDTNIVRVEITLVRVEVTLCVCKLHSVCVNHTLRV
jgi:hypothetical protein